MMAFCATTPEGVALLADKSIEKIVERLAGHPDFDADEIARFVDTTPAVNAECYGAGKAEGAAAPAPASTTGYLAEGRAAYTTLPFTLDVSATLRGKEGYNILVACEPKSSPAHWELFTMPGSGST